MKSKLTVEIERQLLKYEPKNLSGIIITTNRPTYTANEVPVKNGDIKSGLIDIVKVIEYFGSNREIKILTVAMEIKISKSDFLSKSYHSFPCEQNYYIVPDELYSSIISYVPSKIGVILYKNNGTFKIKKKCISQEMVAEEKTMFLLSFFKRLVKQQNKEFRNLTNEHNKFLDSLGQIDGSSGQDIKVKFKALEEYRQAVREGLLIKEKKINELMSYVPLEEICNKSRKNKCDFRNKEISSCQFAKSKYTEQCKKEYFCNYDWK